MENSLPNVNTSNVARVAHFTIVDYSVFSGVLAISLAIGLYFGIFNRKNQSAEEYLHGGRRLQPLPVAFSLVASAISANTIIGEPVEIYIFGWLYFLLIPALIVIGIVSNWLFIPVFHLNGIDNIYAYLEARFCKSLRKIVSVAFIVNGLLYIPIILYIPSLAFSEVTGLNVHVVNSIVCYCCTFYTLLGGIKAVVWTDVVQGLVMVASVVMVVYFGTKRVGGLDDVMIRAVMGKRIYSPDFSLNLTQRHTFWNMLIGTFVLWLWNVSFDQKCVQRIVALPTLSQARRSLAYFICGLCLFMFVNMSIGIVMYAYYHGCDPIKSKALDASDKMIPHFAQAIFGEMAGMSGVFISSIFSASLSTTSTTLNSQAGVIYSDFIRPLNIIRHSERNANYCMKLAIFVMGTFSILGGVAIEKLGSLFQAVYTLSGICAGPIVGVFTLGMLFPCANRHGALFGLLIGMISIGCLIINTQVATSTGLLHVETLPTSVDGCSGNLDLVTFKNITTIPDEEFAFYKISFMWYGPIGLLLTWTSGLVISFFTGWQDLNQFNVNLLSPCVKYLLPQKYRHIQLHTVPEMTSNLEKMPKKIDPLLDFYETKFGTTNTRT